MARKQRYVRKTLLAVGEGHSEKAFLKHLCTLYCSGNAGVAVTIRNAHGKGPENVINTAIQEKTADYDTRLALLDTDILWSEKLKKNTCKAKVEMIGSEPCLEGLLLAILKKDPPGQSGDCKKAIQQFLDIGSTELTKAQIYDRHFPKSVLDDARTRIFALDRLLRFFEGR